MVKKEPVSVNWQTLFAIIPIINLWACYRIENLRLYLLVIIAILVVEFLVVALIFPESFDAFYGLTESEQPIDNSIYILEIGVEVAISIVLIRKWSKEWNESISKNS